MRDLKISVIVAGSTYTTEIIEGLLERKESLKSGNLYLTDIDKNKLHIVGELIKRMFGL